MCYGVLAGPFSAKGVSFGMYVTAKEKCEVRLAIGRLSMEDLTLRWNLNRLGLYQD